MLTINTLVVYIVYLIYLLAAFSVFYLWGWKEAGRTRLVASGYNHSYPKMICKFMHTPIKGDYCVVRYYCITSINGFNFPHPVINFQL